MASNPDLLAGDGFFLNFGMVLLSLCQPILDPKSSKLMKINPRIGNSSTSRENGQDEENILDPQGEAHWIIITCL